MRPEYDFSQAVPNPYSKRLRANDTQGPIATESGEPQSLIDEQVTDQSDRHRFVLPGARLLRLTWRWLQRFLQHLLWRML